VKNTFEQAQFQTLRELTFFGAKHVAKVEHEIDFFQSTGTLSKECANVLICALTQLADLTKELNEIRCVVLIFIYLSCDWNFL
jgi:hypothetical protein